MTERQKKFCDEYLKTLNASQAYLAAYDTCKSTKTAGVNGCRLLDNANITAYIKKRMDERGKRTEITQDRVLKEYARLGFFDPRSLFNDDGSPKQISDLDDDTAAVLAGLEISEIWEGTGDDRQFVGYSKKYKLADKKGALDSIARHLGMFDDRLRVTGDIAISNPLADLTSDELRALIKK